MDTDKKLICGDAEGRDRRTVKAGGGAGWLAGTVSKGEGHEKLSQLVAFGG
jgi:hypothetical protein